MFGRITNYAYMYLALELICIHIEQLPFHSSRSIVRPFSCNLCSDLGHAFQEKHGIGGPFDNYIYDYELLLLDEVLSDRLERYLSNFFPMSLPHLDWTHVQGNCYLNKQFTCNQEELYSLITNN